MDLCIVCALERAMGHNVNLIKEEIIKMFAGIRFLLLSLVYNYYYPYHFLRSKF